MSKQNDPARRAIRYIWRANVGVERKDCAIINSQAETKKRLALIKCWVAGYTAALKDAKKRRGK